MDTIIQQILAHLDIAAYYQEHIQGNITHGQHGWENCHCPLPGHEDKHPSFGFNKCTGAFKCFTCSQSGNLVKFEQLMHGGTYRDAMCRLAEKLKIAVPFNSLEDRVARYHQYLLDNQDNSLTAAEQMGISRDTIVKHRLGYMPRYGKNEARLIFPIFDEHGQVLTLKKYSRQVPHKVKSKFERGGQVSLYGIHQLNGNMEIPVVICAGEKDKCVGESHLGNRFLFVTFTGGEGSMPKDELWNKSVEALRGRDLTICYDADEPGRQGAAKLAQALRGVGRRLSVVEWPATFAQEFPKGDTTDCIMLWDQGGPQVMADILQQAWEVSEPSPVTMPQPQTMRQSGSIIEQDGRYVKVSSKGEATPISNFVIHPIDRLWVDGKEAVKAELVHPKGNYQVTLERESWHARPNFLKEIASIDLAFTGTDIDLQHIQAIVASYDVPVHNGTRILGYQEVEQKKLFILPNGIISTQPAPDIIYVPEKGEHPFLSMFQPKQLPEQGIPGLMQQLFHHLPNLHQSTPLSVFLGWLFATPFKPQLMQRIGHFAILNVYGTKGSGKSSLTLLLWRFLGFHSGEIFSCTQSVFTWLKLLSSTNAYPLFFDEFKPWDMLENDVQRIHRLLRRVYTGEIESRGKPDLSLLHYKLQAPVGILGEVSFREPALLERILPVPLSFQELRERHRVAYKELSALPLEGFLPVYLEWGIQADVPRLWDKARARANFLATGCPDRIRDNIAVALFGLECLQTFASTFHCQMPAFDEKALVQLCEEELCGEVTGGRLAVDTLLEKMAYMAESGILVNNRDYRIEQPNIVCLRLEPCLDKFNEWARKVAFDGEILDAKAYRQMLQERLSTYVVDPCKKVRISTGSYRTVAVDREKAREAGLNLDGFFPS